VEELLAVGHFTSSPVLGDAFCVCKSSRVAVYATGTFAFGVSSERQVSAVRSIVQCCHKV